ncbi:Dabb family protein [Flavobacteriaceae sp. LMIT009]
MKTKFLILLLTSLILGCTQTKDKTVEQDITTNNDEGLSSNNIETFNNSFFENTQTIGGEFAHIVLIWLKEPNNETVHTSFQSALQTMVKNSLYIKSAHLGSPANTNRDIVDNSYTYCYIATFASKEDQDSYQTEKAHDVFREKVGHLFDKIVIYDSFGL